MIKVIVDNFLASLLYLPYGEFLQRATARYFGYTPLLLIVLLVIGFMIGYQIPEQSKFFTFMNRKGLLLLALFSSFAIAGVGVLYLKVLTKVYIIALLICLSLVSIHMGLQYAVRIRKNGWYLLYTLCVIVLFIGVYLINGAPAMSISPGTSKEQLRETWKSITGENPNAEEKRTFWKGALGEDNPNSNKKSDYWDAE